MRYDANDLLNDEEILLRARQEYTSNRLPCEGIQVLCLNTIDGVSYDKECWMNYGLTDEVDMHHILRDRSLCFWIDINLLYQPYCDGLCGVNTIIYEHPIEITLWLKFGADNEHSNEDDFGRFNTTAQHTVCEQYFGDSNKTKETLSDIDVILGLALQFVARSEKDMIHRIEDKPRSVLMDNPCINTNAAIMDDVPSAVIESVFSVESALNDSNTVYSLFDADSDFMNATNSYLFGYFGMDFLIVFPERNNTINVTRIVFEQIYSEQKTWYELWQVHVALSLTLLAIIAAFVGLNYYKRKVEREREINTLRIKNPMVLAIAIQSYHPYNTDLFGIYHDITNVHKFFQLTLNYEMFPPYSSSRGVQFQLQWTQKELVAFLKKKANELNDNLKLNEGDPYRYDGLVVVISGHGKEHHFITSDGEETEKTTIHRIFSGPYSQIRKIPRVFVYDACAGTHGKNMKIASGDVDKHRAVIKMKTEQYQRTSVCETWTEGEANVDHLLMTIQASNLGYKSKLNQKTGSHFISAFCEEMERNILENNNHLFLGEVFEKVQSELHNREQLPVMTENSKTQYIKFEPRSDRDHELEDDAKENGNELEMQIADGVQSKEDGDAGTGTKKSSIINEVLSSDSEPDERI
eukprot:886301_1